MSEQNTSILIIGAGLCGLTLAYRLQQSGRKVLVIEARDRTGGRIETVAAHGGTPIEMGATWLGQKHTALTSLLQELQVGITEQYLSERAIYEPLSTSPPQLVQLPPNDAPSYRIAGGSSLLIERLAAELPTGTIRLGTTVKGLRFTENGVEVLLEDEALAAEMVISTLPPHLLLQSISMYPALPAELQELAMQTHTWMGESIKFGFSYAEPFWRTPKMSGTLVSNVGPVNEMYDHSNPEEGCFALKGFLNGAYATLSREERRDLILNQLHKYYGSLVDNYTDYQERVWSQEPLTYQPYPNGLLPHQNNGHQQYRQPFYGNRFFIAGAETAEQFPGYMDGAVRSADFVFQQITSS